MNDLSHRADIKILVDTFYNRIVKHTELGPIFNDIMKVDWDHHLPKMYDFWESIVFGAGAYKGNPMLVHFGINREIPLLPHLFDEWLKLWHETVDELYQGENAEAAKSKAKNIAGLMSYKMDMDRRLNPKEK